MSIGERIREFAISRYGTISKLARVMDMSPSNLLAYVSDKREPGTKLLLKLHKAGADITWIITGREYEEPQNISIIFDKYKIKSLGQLSEILDYFFTDGGLIEDIRIIIKNRLQKT